MRAAGLLCLSLLAPCAPQTRLGAQSTPKLSQRQSDQHAESALAELQAEGGRGPYFFYTQQYRSSGKLVSLHGSFYDSITSVHRNGCGLSIETTAFDHFSGREGKRQIHDTWTRYKYEARFELSPEIADALRVISARPIQLQSGTYAVCGANRGCTIDWLEIHSPRAELRLRTTTNDVADYDGTVQVFEGMTTKFLLPLSSAAAGESIAAKLQTLARACRNQSTTAASP